jgi:hypothetical protein
MTIPVRTNIFPCKSINLMKFLKQNDVINNKVVNIYAIKYKSKYIYNL